MAYAFYKRKLKQKNKTASTSSGSSQKTYLPNSMMMSIMEDPRAEQEADRLSQGITSSTPDEIMREMGSRLGADFSDVQFHSDSLSMKRGQAMGAKAWARGRDIYFGKSGFEPRAAAHELVHTVQQGAVKGNASISMPYGAVQMLPLDEDENLINTNAIQNVKKSGADPLEAQILTSLTSEFGSRCYRKFEKKLKEMVKQGGGKNIPTYSQKGAIHFLVEGANRDRSGKEILEEIAQQPLQTKDDADQRAKEYKELIKFLSTRLGDFGLEELAIDSNLTDPRKRMKFKHTRSTKDSRTQRAYELESSTEIQEGQEGYDAQKEYNPTNDPELEQVQTAIDNAKNASEAYRTFARFSGNSGGSLIDLYDATDDVDITLFKKKLKAMTRVVVDYPELRGKIGDMRTLPEFRQNEQTGQMEENPIVMSTGGAFGGRRKADINYNAYKDRKGPDMDAIRKDKEDKGFKHNLYAAPSSYSGTHEQGHILASLLEDSENSDKAVNEHESFKIENDMLTDIVNDVQNNTGAKDAEGRNILSDQDLQNLQYKNQKFGNKQSINLIDLRKSKWYKKGGQQKIPHTSVYGSESPAEMFGEAVSDVYAHGKKARPMSIELVKRYEKKQKAETKKRFFAKTQKKGFFEKYFGWIPRLFGF